MTYALSNRTKVSDELAIHLAESLARGEFTVGDTIPSEVELAEKYGVSRPVAREAVQMLALAGMLLVQHGKRTIVRSEREWNVLSPSVQVAFERAGRDQELRDQLYDVRLVLESACAEFAARNADDAERAEVEKVVELTLSLTHGPMDRFLEVDFEFHSLLYSLTGNLPLSQLARDVQGYLASSWKSSRLGESDMAESAEQHAAIGRAIVAGDAAAARESMEHHIKWAATIERLDVSPVTP